MQAIIFKVPAEMIESAGELHFLTDTEADELLDTGTMVLENGYLVLAEGKTWDDYVRVSNAVNSWELEPWPWYDNYYDNE